MLEKVENIATLISKYQRNELTAEENAVFNKWLSESEEHRKLLAELSFDNIIKTKMETFTESEIPGGWDRIQQLMNAGKPAPIKRGRPLLIKLRNTAACLLALAGSCYFAFLISDKVNTSAATFDRVPAPAGLFKPAVKVALQTADHTTIALHNVKDGTVRTEGAYKIIKSKDYLSYKPGFALSAKKTLYNTITTPPGGQYRVVLPDGSTISMNVASSVTFKVSSAGSIREVSMTGEAEFDITTNPDQPFMVTILPQNNWGKAATVKVTGTRFNINAYNDKKITLLEGSLQVTGLSQGDPESKIASPQAAIDLEQGEQARITYNGSINILRNVDTSGIVAWKKGYIPFFKSPREILNLVERWYDVEVIYQTDNLPQKAISGAITPGMNVSSVIDILHHQYNGLHLRYDSIQNKIVVLP